MSYSFDASSVIHLWDNYPIANDHFNSLWKKFFKDLKNKTFTISNVALKQVEDKIPDFKIIEEEGILIPEAESSEDLFEVQNMKKELGIQEEGYHPKGVDEKDLCIIAIAKRNNHMLVSEEFIQTNLPTEKRRYKIPAVCKEIARIECCNIKDLLNQKIL